MLSALDHWVGLPCPSPPRTTVSSSVRGMADALGLRPQPYTLAPPAFCVPGISQPSWSWGGAPSENWGCLSPSENGHLQEEGRVGRGGNRLYSVPMLGGFAGSSRKVAAVPQTECMGDIWDWTHTGRGQSQAEVGGDGKAVGFSRWKPVSVSEEAGQEAGLGAQGQARCGGEGCGRGAGCPALQQELADPEKDNPRLGTHKAAVKRNWGAPEVGATSPFPLPHPKDVYMCSRTSLAPSQGLPKVAPKSEFPLITENGDRPSKCWTIPGLRGPLSSLRRNSRAFLALASPWNHGPRDGNSNADPPPLDFSRPCLK